MSIEFFILFIETEKELNSKNTSIIMIRKNLSFYLSQFCLLRRKRKRKREEEQKMLQILIIVGRIEIRDPD